MSLRLYLIILATVFNLLHKHKMQTEYIFVFIKEWHEKAPKTGLMAISRDIFQGFRPGSESVHQDSAGERYVHPWAAFQGGGSAYASDKFDSRVRQPLNESFAATLARSAASGRAAVHQWRTLSVSSAESASLRREASSDKWPQT